MIDLMNCNDKKQKIEDFFCWLLDRKEVELKSDLDMTLVTDYDDPNIYYPAEIEAFFETKAMRRIAKVSQLGEVLGKNKNCYQNRLEHSKGTYNRKLEELIYLYNDKNYRKYIEENNMKLYLVAELIKEAGHDIGHPPLSHGVEIHVIGRRGVHEDIGKRILLEDSEITAVLRNIDKKLPQVLQECLEKDILNSAAHDESNYDVDRLDYLNRDSLYRGEKISLNNEGYSIVYAKTDGNGKILKNTDGSIALANESDEYKCRIDVYENASLNSIEQFLNERLNLYKEIYYSDESLVRAACTGLFIKELQEYDLSEETELKDFFYNVRQKEAKDIDIHKYLQFDELKFYKDCIKIAQNSKNKDFKVLTCMVIPPIDALMNFTFYSLELKNKKKYTEQEAEFIELIKKLITEDSDVSRNMKNINFFKENCKWVQDDNVIELLKAKWGDKINYTSAKAKGYKKELPIYVKDKLGKIYELNENPDRSFDWNNEERHTNVAFVVPALLRLKGISEEEIKAILFDFNNPDYGTNFKCKNDQKPAKEVGNPITRYFKELEIE